MIDKTLAFVAPHHCYSCQKTGPVLCDSCKYDIVDDAQNICIVCGAANEQGICTRCGTFYEKAWQIGERDGVLLKLIDDYKFERVRAAGDIAADLLHDRLPILPDNTIVVPVPTISAHIRQRGYDHTAIIAKRFAKLRKLPHRQLLLRKSDTHQRGSDRKTRFAQAESAFSAGKKLDKTAHYLVVDDILTTGATLQFAAKALKGAGATSVWVAILARQPLDKSPFHLLK